MPLILALPLIGGAGLVAGNVLGSVGAGLYARLAGPPREGSAVPLVIYAAAVGVGAYAAWRIVK